MNPNRSTRLRILAISKSIFSPISFIFAWFEFVWLRLLPNFSPKATFRHFLWLCKLFDLSWVFSFSWVCILSNIQISSCDLTMFEDDGLDFSLFQFLKSSACYACKASNFLTCETFRLFDFLDVLSRKNPFVIIWESFRRLRHFVLMKPLDLWLVKSPVSLTFFLCLGNSKLHLSFIRSVQVSTPPHFWVLTCIRSWPLV